MALSSLSGSRCALWPALLQTSWPKPAWFGSPAPAAAKSGNEVNERVVLGHFPLISTQLKSSWGCDLRHRTFQPPPLGSRTQGRRCACWGVPGGGAGAGVGAEAAALLLQEHRTQGCLRAGTGRQPWWVWGERPGPAGEREARRAEQPGTGADVGYPSSPPASVPGSPSPPPKEGCFHRVVAGSRTWIPEVPGNRLELGWPGVSMAQARTRPHSPRE